jgi:hypothetical protein
LAYALFKKKKKKEAFIKPFEKDLEKPLCAGILRKWLKKKKKPPCSGGCFPKNCF